MFKRIKGKNLFSWENLNYEVCSGISQIVGTNYDDGNSEGSGKSSIPNILCWVLYGGIPKSARIDDVIRQGCDSGSGEVEFDSGYSVSRSRHPNDLAIRTPDGKTVKGKDAKETQLLINKLVGLDFGAFCQTVYFAQNYPNKFISSSETDKVGILSEIQDLTKLDKARKDVLELLKKEAATKVDLDRQHLQIESSISRVVSNMELLESFLKKFDGDKAAKLAKLSADEADLAHKLQEAESVVDTFSADAVETVLKHCEEELQALEARKVKCNVAVAHADATRRDQARLKKSIKDLQAAMNQVTARLDRLHDGDLPDNCPTCGQKAPSETLEQHKREVEAQRQEYKAEYNRHLENQDRVRQELNALQDPPSVEEAEQAIGEANREILAVNARKKKLWQMQETYKSAVKECRDLKGRMAVVVAEMAATEDQKPTKELAKLKALEEELVGLDANLEEIKDALHHLDRKLQNYEILKNGFKEVKQYIFQALLNELSVKSTKLASDLFEVPVSVKFSNDDAEGGVSKIQTLVTLDGCERSLGLLSGGQYKRVELATDLALAMIVANRSQNPINFRILDEPMKDLSLQSKEKVVELLKGLRGVSIIIEHDPIIKSIVHQIFDVSYKNGVSVHAA